MNAALPTHALPEIVVRAIPPAMLEALKSRFGDRCSTAAAVREQHGRDESPFPVTPPEAVVFCESTDEVAAVVKLAHEHAVPVIPYGVGSSLEGHLLAVQGGVSVDVSRMTKVVQVNPEDLTVTVEAGVTREQLNAEIRDTGLFFPIDPARMRRSAAWRRRARAARTRCATARCARTCSGLPSSPPAAT